MGQKEGEYLSAIPVYGAAFACVPAQDIGDFFKYIITVCGAVKLVIELEIVQIHKHEGNRIVFAGLKFGCNSLGEIFVVIYVGQAVNSGLPENTLIEGSVFDRY